MADEWLIFVDTNIFLDFYRFPGESAKRQMEALERHKGRLITSEQVQMEFLKNRQKVILQAFDVIKKPTKTAFPQILADSEPARLMRKSEVEAEKRYKQLRDRVENILKQPAQYDDVLRVLNRIFGTKTALNLSRENKAKLGVRNRAKKRFSLGYPPRKPNDNSIGDAIHWEWIIECARNSAANQHILVVCRDGDFGSRFGDEDYLNDWLKKEFKDRVSPKRKIELTNKFTVALKLLEEVVRKEDEEEEEKVIKSSKIRLAQEGKEQTSQSLEILRNLESLGFVSLPSLDPDGN